jgi:hypothetical protein
VREVGVVVDRERFDLLGGDAGMREIGAASYVVATSAVQVGVSEFPVP